MRAMSDRIVLVSGAARGIGRAVAERLAAAGDCVFGMDVAEPDEPVTAFDLRHCDVAVEAEVARLITEIDQRHGRIDVVANIAGVVVVGPIEHASWEEYRRVSDVNVGGVFLVCKHAVPVMRRQRAGVIVNAGSVSGHVGQVDHAIYGATKAAVISLTRALAWELAPAGIRVCSVSPGSVDTAMLRADCMLEAERTGRSFDDVKAEREAEQAFRRWADPDEIASVVEFLASPGASYITGADVLADCGWTAK
jgi:NAD(P)-dependent dehydrogenase (short-subunit alcohol dehydrogenase family)